MKKILTFLIFGLCNLIFASDGNLDISFNSDGIAIQSFRTSGDEELYDFKLLPDGSMIALIRSLGEITIVKIDSNGNKISQFGTNNSGYTNINFSSYSYINSNVLEVQPDGKILFSGELIYSNITYVFIARLNSDGTFDTSFGSSSWPFGVSLIDLGFYDYQINDLKIFPNGKIICTGFVKQTNTYYAEDVFVIKFNSDGTLDNSFGVNGVFLFDNSDKFDVAYQIEVLDSSELLVFGESTFADDSKSAVLLRLDENGNFIQKFGDGGLLSLNLNLSTYFKKILFFEDGKFIVPTGNYEFHRFHQNGQKDFSYGSNGVLQIQPNGKVFSDFELLKDSKVILMGWEESAPIPIGSGTDDIFFMKINQNGLIDSTFGNNGTSTINFTVSDEIPNSIQISPNGKIIISGNPKSFVSPNKKFFLGKVLNSVDLVSTKISVKMVNFEDTFTGNSKTSDIKIFNKGGSDLILNNFIISSPFAFNSNFNLSLPYAIQPNDSVSIQLDFLPNAVFQNYGTITILSNVAPYDVALEGTGIGSTIENSDTLDFELVFAEWGEKVEKISNLQISNLGNSILEIDSLNFVNPFGVKFESLATLPIQIQPNTSFDLPIKFSTDFQGTFTGTMNLDTNDFLNGTKSITLIAESEFKFPNISVIEDTLNLGNIALNSGQNAIDYVFVNIQNIGNGILNIEELDFFGQDSNNFSINENLPLTLQPNEIYGIGVTFTSFSSGIFESNLEIKSNDLVNEVVSIKLLANVIPTELEETSNLIPKKFTLLPNYPNPFNPSTKISFGIPELSKVKLEIFNVLGQKVKTLVEKELSPSFYTFEWNGTDDFNNRVSNGVYLLKMQAGKFSETRKMTILK